MVTQTLADLFWALKVLFVGLGRRTDDAEGEGVQLEGVAGSRWVRVHGLEGLQRSGCHDCVLPCLRPCHGARCGRAKLHIPHRSLGEQQA